VYLRTFYSPVIANVGWYILFGALHECSRVLTAILSNLANRLLDNGYIDFLFYFLLGRHCAILEAGHAAVCHAGCVPVVLGNT